MRNVKDIIVTDCFVFERIIVFYAGLERRYDLLNFELKEILMVLKIPEVVKSLYLILVDGFTWEVRPSWEGLSRWLLHQGLCLMLALAMRANALRGKVYRTCSFWGLVLLNCVVLWGKFLLRLPEKVCLSFLLVDFVQCLAVVATFKRAVRIVGRVSKPVETEQVGTIFLEWFLQIKHDTQHLLLNGLAVLNCLRIWSTSLNR